MISSTEGENKRKISRMGRFKRVRVSLKQTIEEEREI